MLQINKKALMNEILSVFTVELFSILENWKSDVYKFTGSVPSFVSSMKASYEIKKEASRVVAYLKANPQLLATSYGTGSLMLTDNPGLEEYKRSKYWNKDRRGNAIYGRPEGEYLNLFRGTIKTSGKYKGKNLEATEVFGKKPVKLLSPTKAIQTANDFLYKTYIPRALKNTINKVINEE